MFLLAGLLWCILSLCFDVIVFCLDSFFTALFYAKPITSLLLFPKFFFIFLHSVHCDFLLLSRLGLLGRSITNKISSN